MRARTFRAASALALCLPLIAAWPSGAAAATGTVEVEHQRGPLINAFFTAFDGSGCVETDTFVTANAPTDHHGPEQISTVVAAVSVFIYDMCTDTTVLQVAGFADNLPLDAFVVSNQLDLASLHATIPVNDLDTGAASELDVNVNLAGTSDIHRDHSNTNDLYGGGCHVLNRWNGSGRTAMAWGTVSDGVTNYIPAPTDQGEIGFVHDGFVVIGCA